MFVILAYQRSGTHMLGTLLNSHPKLRCYDEVLLTERPPDNLLLGRKNVKDLKKNEGCIVMYNYFIKACLKDKVKICNARIIHMTRTNVNNHVKSLIKKGKFPKNINNRNAERLIQHVRNIILKEKFKNVYEITYEEICKNKSIKEYRNNNLMKFLGVEPHTLTTNLAKGTTF